MRDIARSTSVRTRLLALVVAAVTLCTSAPAVAQHRRQKAERPRAAAADWWRTAVYYEVYPRSFKDSDGDGVGDLDGITEELDYLAGIGVDAIWITPFYPSPQVDFGYDVSDYRNVDPQFGTLADFDRLVAEAHKRNIRVVCDLVMNHSSDQHPDFVESRSSRTSPKRDWYVWHDPAPDGGPPNNWSALFGGSAWTLDEKTGQYYYHFFYPQQPDLNWRNPEVVRSMAETVAFWFRRGVDGFRVDAIEHVFEDPKLRDNPTTGRTRRDGTPEQRYLYTAGLAENHRAFRALRRAVDAFGRDRVLIGETYKAPRDLVPYYGGRVGAEFHMPFNFSLLEEPRLDAAAFRRAVGDVERALRGRPINYVLSNHDRPRAFDRFGDGVHDDEIAKLLALMLLTLRGAPFFYYGEEIGMKTTPPLRKEDVRDPVGKVFWPEDKGRDGERTPMQWTPGRNAGFSTAEKTWLPVPPVAATRNVETMSADPKSVLSFFRAATRLRRDSRALRDGNYAAIGNDPNVFVYRRRAGRDVAIVALNMSPKPRTVRLGRTGLRLALSTLGARGDALQGGTLHLAPFEGIVVSSQ